MATMKIEDGRVLPRLTRAEVLALIARARQGDEGARNELITFNNMCDAPQAVRSDAVPESGTEGSSCGFIPEPT